MLRVSVPTTTLNSRSISRVLLLVAFLTLSERAFAAPTSSAWIVKQTLKEAGVKLKVPPVELLADLMSQSLAPKMKLQYPHTAMSVTSEPLRLAPTRFGKASPKYYAWVVVRDSEQTVISEGAARFTLVSQKKLKMTDFIPAIEIQSHPLEVEKIFPGELVSTILEKSKK
jgi:hypothetical protein